MFTVSQDQKYSARPRVVIIGGGVLAGYRQQQR